MVGVHLIGAGRRVGEASRPEKSRPSLRNDDRRPGGRGIGGYGPEEDSIVAGGSGPGQRSLGCRMDGLPLGKCAATAS